MLTPVHNFTLDTRGMQPFGDFVYLMGVIFALLGINIWSLTFPTSPLKEDCQKNPEVFGIEPALCSRIVLNGIYEPCVINALPNVKQCSKFITN